VCPYWIKKTGFHSADGPCAQGKHPPGAGQLAPNTLDALKARIAAANMAAEKAKKNKGSKT